MSTRYIVTVFYEDRARAHKVLEFPTIAEARAVAASESLKRGVQMAYITRIVEVHEAVYRDGDVT